MKTISRIVLLTTLITTTAAVADPADGFGDHPVAPIHSAFELALGGSYTQGAGATGAGSDVQDIAGPGGSGELQLGYRATPNLTIGAYGTFEGFAAGDMLSEKTNDVGGASVGLKSDWHFRPARSVDPWVSLGGGMRWLVVDQNNKDTASLRGLDLARMQVGVDYRISQGFSIAPVIGATATMYLDQDMGAGYQALDTKKLSWTFSGGIVGRFDLGL